MEGSKVTIFWCLFAAATASPAKLPSTGYGYREPPNPFPHVPPAPEPPQSLYETPVIEPESLYGPPVSPPKVPDTLYNVPSGSNSVQVTSGHEETHQKGMPFDFAYSVQDSYKGLHFGHDSDSDGKTVEGEYRVALPDGRTQIVTYTADWKNGYHADVTYEGEATYPQPQPYQPPQPQTYQPPQPQPAPTFITPTQTYGAPSPAPSYQPPSQSYGTPVQSHGNQVQSYRPPVQEFGTPVQSYGTPAHTQITPSISFKPPTNLYEVPSPAPAKPSPTYGVPSSGFKKPQSLYAPPGH